MGGGDPMWCFGGCFRNDVMAIRMITIGLQGVCVNLKRSKLSSVNLLK